MFNLGTNDGKSADPALAGAGRRQIMAESGQTWVVNGRFKGGWITRHYGDPANGVHALQMELACRGYMREPDGTGDAGELACRLRPRLSPRRCARTLTEILETAIALGAPA